MSYWARVGKRAWREAVKAAWGDALAATKTVAIPIIGAVIVWAVTGISDASALVKIAASVAGGAILSLVFFAGKMLSIPPRMDAECMARIAALEAASAVASMQIDLSAIQSLLARMRDKCLACRSKVGADLAHQYDWADQLISDIDVIYGPEVVLSLKHVLPRLTTRSLGAVEMDGNMKAMAGNLEKLMRDVKETIFSSETRDLNAYVRRRLAELRAEQTGS